MRIIIIIFFAIMLFSPYVSAEKMRMCKDEKGHVTFTQTGCPKNASRKQILVPQAQAPIRPLSNEAIQELSRIEQKKHSSDTNREEIEVEDDDIEVRNREIRNKEITKKYLEQDLKSSSSLRRKWAREKLIEMGEYKTPRNTVTTEPAVPGQLIDPFTGTVMPRTGGGYTDPRTGTFYHDVGGGVVNTRTGKFTPTH